MFVVNELGFFVSHRLSIAQAVKQNDNEVHIVYGTLGNADTDILKAAGYTLHFVPIRRSGMNPLAEIRSLLLMWQLFRRVRPNLVHLVAIKSVLYGGIASRLAQVPAVVSAMTGLGYVFIDQSGVRLKTVILRRLIKLFLKSSLGHPHQKLIFQNPDDRDFVLARTKALPQQTRLIRGSGIDLKLCPMIPEPEGEPIVVMAARLLRDKGVIEYVEAAHILRNRGIKARYWLIGEPDLENRASVSHGEVAEWQAEGVVEYFGYQRDVPSIYVQAHIVTLPSYREGLPKSLIEAAACGRAVVTTDVPGCRDAIEPGVSGILVPVRDKVALANAIQYLIENPERRKQMGAAGRLLAEREFTIEKVVNEHLEIYRELMEQ